MSPGFKAGFAITAGVLVALVVFHLVSRVLK